MILIECPNCGPRNVQEFRYGNGATLAVTFAEVVPRQELGHCELACQMDYLLQIELPKPLALIDGLCPGLIDYPEEFIARVSDLAGLE